MSEARRQVLAQLAALEADFAPFEQLKADLAAARTHYRELTGAFVDELKARCTGMGKEDKGALVLELFAQDVAGGLDAAVAEKRQELVGFVDRVWEKYRVTLADLREQRRGVEDGLGGFLQRLGFA